MKIAVYPGSFDPITNGHLDIIERAKKVFDKVFVAVLKNPEKKQHFSLEDRVEMVKGSVAGISGVEVESFDGLLVDFAVQKGACAIIRGLRAVSDFEYEFQLALTNAQLKPEIETVFFMTGSKYSYLSSSLVLQIASFGGETGGFVPEIVNKKIKGVAEWRS